jgi:ribokinase
MAEIVVVGSLNADTTVRVPRLPQPGETVLGSGHFDDTGGKGANQAVAAARLGRSVAMIGAVGADADGDRLVTALEAAGVDASGVRRDPDRPTGIAHITVDDAGENMIVVDPGANAGLDSEHVERHRDLLAGASVVMAQLEVPLEAVELALTLAGGTTILNPAPGRALADSLLERVGVLVPNQTELGMLAGEATPDGPLEAGRLARSLPATAVVVTLGAAGALLVSGDAARHVAAPRIEAVDPTGAGDAFCGGLADAIARGLGLREAVEWAVRCGAAAATRWGAQASLPTRDDVEALG